MLTPLTHALAAVEGVADRTKAAVKRRFDLWDHVHALPFAAWGTEREVRFLGRVLDDHKTEDEAGLSRLESARLTFRRFKSDEVPRATVRLTLAGQWIEAETDGDGYYDAVMELEAPLAGGPWFEAEARVLDPVYSPPTRARVVIPTPEATFAVLSDMDDTVLRTGATNKLRFTKVVTFGNATTREVFPGVGAFYHALQAGASGELDEEAAVARGEREAGGPNPLFYVSSSPWNLYQQFVGTLEHRGVPHGPLFLKDFGIDPGKFIKTGHGSHKLDWIGTVFGTYPDLPFVLIGDSGQEDAEIYQEAVRRHPGQVRAVFIRDVTDEARDREVHRIARDVEARGVPMRLVKTTVEAAEAAADLGLIAPEAVGVVRRAAREERLAEEA